MLKRGRLLAAILVIVLGLAGGSYLYGWYAAGPLEEDTPFIVRGGSTLTSVAQDLEEQGAVKSASSFLTRAKILGGPDPVKRGEFLLPAGASGAKILGILQSSDVIRRFIAVPEGMPSILVWERLMAQPELTGEIPVPAEGSILPDSYDYERGENRAEVVARMQEAMSETLKDLWARRAATTVAKTPQEALALASIVEKETGKPSERRMVAGLYSNRLRQGMMLQADPTIIYPITKGKPLGRRIRQSEIAAINDYNTYSMVGLPKGPITNPGRASIEAVLNPAKTEALYMVADGTKGHKFGNTLEEHNANVAEWFALRRKRGEM